MAATPRTAHNITCGDFLGYYSSILSPVAPHGNFNTYLSYFHTIGGNVSEIAGGVFTSLADTDAVFDPLATNLHAYFGSPSAEEFKKIFKAIYDDPSKYWSDISKSVETNLFKKYKIAYTQDKSIRKTAEHTIAGSCITEEQCNHVLGSIQTFISASGVITCAYCGIEKTDPNNDSNTNGTIHFSCEHYLEVLLLSMCINLTPEIIHSGSGNPNYQKLIQLLKIIGCYSWTCERCNKIKSGVQSGAGIFVDIVPPANIFQCNENAFTSFSRKFFYPKNMYHDPRVYKEYIINLAGGALAINNAMTDAIRARATTITGIITSTPPGAAKEKAIKDLELLKKILKLPPSGDPTTYAAFDITDYLNSDTKKPPKSLITVRIEYFHELLMSLPMVDAAMVEIKNKLRGAGTNLIGHLNSISTNIWKDVKFMLAFGTLKLLLLSAIDQGKVACSHTLAGGKKNNGIKQIGGNLKDDLINLINDEVHLPVVVVDDDARCGYAKDAATHGDYDDDDYDDDDYGDDDYGDNDGFGALFARGVDFDHNLIDVSEDGDSKKGEIHFGDLKPQIRVKVQTALGNLLELIRRRPGERIKSQLLKKAQIAKDKYKGVSSPFIQVKKKPQYQNYKDKEDKERMKEAAIRHLTLRGGKKRKTRKNKRKTRKIKRKHNKYLKRKTRKA
jgi:hypothetical protein